MWLPWISTFPNKTFQYKNKKMKKIKHYEQKQIENFYSEIYFPNKNFDVNNMRQSARLFLTELSRYFNLGELNIDAVALTRLQILFEGSEKDLDTKYKEMFADILSVIIGQVIVNDLNGFWDITENPDTEIFELAVSFYDQNNSTFFPFSYGHKYFFIGTRQLRPLDVFCELFKRLQFSGAKICQCLKISMSEFLALDHNTKQRIMYLFHQHFRIGGRETKSHIVILIQINNFYVECFSNKKTRLVEKHKVLDASSSLLCSYFK